MMSQARQSIRAALDAVPARRRAALRRPDDPDALLATDLPFIADEQALADFTAHLAEMGWHAWQKGGWLLMDGPVDAPFSPVPAVLTGEAGCCISLLLRHPGGGEDDAQRRALIKAADAGKPHLERCCAALHAAWAARLRHHQALPSALLPWLCRAMAIN